MGQHFQYKMNNQNDWRNQRSRACFGWMACLDDYGIQNNNEEHIEKIRFSMNDSNRVSLNIRNELIHILAEVGNMLPYMKGRFSIPEIDSDTLSGVFDDHQPMEIDIKGVPADFLMASLFFVRNPMYANHMILMKYMLNQGVAKELAATLASCYYPLRGFSGFSGVSYPTGDAKVFDPYEFTPATFRLMFYGNGFQPDQPEWGVGDNLPYTGYIREGRNRHKEISEIYTSHNISPTPIGSVSLGTMMDDARSQGDSLLGFRQFIKAVTGKDYNLSIEGLNEYATEIRY